MLFIYFQTSYIEMYIKFFNSTNYIFTEQNIKCYIRTGIMHIYVFTLEEELICSWKRLTQNKFWSNKLFHLISVSFFYLFLIESNKTVEKKRQKVAWNISLRRQIKYEQQKNKKKLIFKGKCADDAWDKTWENLHAFCNNMN